MPARSLASNTLTNWPGLRKGSGFKSTAYTTLKMAVFAPMPKGQREDSHRREGRIAAQLAETGAKILSQCVHQGQPPLLAIVFLHLVHAAESSQGRVTGLLRRHPAADVLLHQHLEVRAQFLLAGPLRGAFAETGHRTVPAALSPNSCNLKSATFNRQSFISRFPRAIGRSSPPCVPSFRLRGRAASCRISSVRSSARAGCCPKFPTWS